MTKTVRHAAASATLGFAMLTSAVPSLHAQATPGTQVAQTQQAPPKHHSKLKGALVGAAAGHMLGGHAKAGAVAGAMWQHHKNKKAELKKAGAK